MGRPKELLEFQGVTCLELVLGACADAGLAMPILVTRGERSEDISQLLSRKELHATIAINPAPELGQTSSLRSGLEQLPASADAFVIYPVDHPLVTARDVRRLADAFATGAGASLPPVLVAPSFAGRRGHPVFVDARLAPAILALAPGDSAREVLRAHADRTHFVTFDDDRALVDMDTPAAYQACLQRLLQRRDAPGYIQS
jgi:molybdenum cofactor cytidylyltransferase